MKICGGCGFKLECIIIQVDVEDPDNDKYPLFSGARGVQCDLQEGELLYIPREWWHYVRSLSLSFSVSFWWN